MIFCTLKSLMETYGVTQTKISEATGVTRPTLVQLIKNENQNIKYDTIDKLCDYFNIEMDELIKRSKYEMKYKGSQIKYDDTHEYERTYPEMYIESIIAIGKKQLKFISNDLNPYFDNERTMGINLEKSISFICEIDTDSFVQYFIAEIDGETFYSFLDSFGIREKIAEELDLDTKMTSQLDFKFNIINSETRDLDFISKELQKLTKEELYSLFLKHFNNDNKNANDIRGMISRDYFDSPYSNLGKLIETDEY